MLKVADVEGDLWERLPRDPSQLSHQRHQLRLLGTSDGRVVGGSSRLGDEDGLDLVEVGLHGHVDCPVWLLSDLSSEEIEVSLLALVLLDVESLQDLVHGLLVLLTFACMKSVVNVQDENALEDLADPEHEDTRE